ncbi:hypothetical protein [Marinimicrobium locisalis]|uniref:hypothetical protein n=1 Tax=Marinimicrobium locisalis TaxID=546022 RepID=UPI003222183A
MPRRYIPFVIIVTILIVGGGYFYHVESSYIEGMKEASGQVVDFEMREGSTVSAKQFCNEQPSFIDVASQGSSQPGGWHTVLGFGGAQEIAAKS